MVLQDYTPQHMLATLRTRLLVMYAQVDIALEEAARSYEKGEAVRAIAVCDGDTAIDALENEIDELCLRLMARIKPVAGDLRFVVAALRMVVDLERIGDEAVTVAEQTVLMEDVPGRRILADEVCGMMQRAREAFMRAMDCFREGNGEEALALRNCEDEALQNEMRIVQRLLELLRDKNAHELHAAALQSGLDEAAANALTAILSLHGPFGTTLAAARSQCQCEAQQDALLELQSLQNELGDAGRGMQLDLSLAGDMEYYNGLVFSGYVAGVPRAVLKGGRYDLLAQRFTPGACALGFALYLDELERLSAPLPPVQQQGTERQWLNIALPKGRLGDKAYGLLAAAGYEANENYNETRKLVVENPEAGVRYFLVKPSDVAIYVEHGAADIGIVGKDILTESGADVYELLDTGMGKCRMCVAGPRNFVDDESRALRVATKFVNIARAHYESIGRDIDIIKLNGSIELAPILGLSDVIVDIVETGTTLKENNLTVLEEFMPISARFIANKASYKFKYAQLTELLNKMKEALAK